mgnify:CR=1 FL=1
MIKHRRVFTAFDGVEYPTAEEAKQAFHDAIKDYDRLDITFKATGQDGNTLRIASTKDDARHYVILQSTNCQADRPLSCKHAATSRGTSDESTCLARRVRT